MAQMEPLKRRGSSGTNQVETKALACKTKKPGHVDPLGNKGSNDVKCLEVSSRT